MPVLHDFVDAIPDDPASQAAGKVLPSHWNDGHVVDVDLSSEVSGQVDLANLPTIADDRVLGNVSGGASTPSELTGAEVKALIGAIDLSTDVTGDLPLGNIADIATDRILGNNNGSPAAPEALTGAEVKAIIGAINLATDVTGDLALGSIADIADQTVLANISGGAAAPSATSINTIKDPKVTSVAYSASLTINASTGDVFDVTLTGNLALDFSNGSDGRVTRVRLTQGGAGSYTLTLGSSINVGTDSASPTLSTAVGARDYLAFSYHSGDGKWDYLSAARGF